MVDLPFPSNDRGVTVFSQDSGKGCELLRAQTFPSLSGRVMMTGPTMAKRILSSQEGNARWTAHGHAPSRFIPNALLGQPVDVGGLVLRAIGAYPVTPKVIG